jgi:hypothetical protein
MRFRDYFQKNQRFILFYLLGIGIFKRCVTSCLIENLKNEKKRIELLLRKVSNLEKKALKKYC